MPKKEKKQYDTAKILLFIALGLWLTMAIIGVVKQISHDITELGNILEQELD